MKIWGILAVVGGLCLSSAANAQATVLVSPKRGYAWWVSNFDFLPAHKQDGGVSIADIDRWINANRGMKLESKTCYMSFVKEREVVSFDRPTLDDIRAKFDEYPNGFDQSFEPVEGERFRVRVGVFEQCPDAGSTTTPLRYMAVVVTDQSNKVRNFDALEWNFVRLHKGDDGKMFALGCYECGEVTELLWDRGNDRFYYQWVGH